MKPTTSKGLHARMIRYIDGDKRAFAELHQMMSSRLRGFLIKLVRDEATADDLFQLTLLKAHLARERFQVRTSDPDGAVEAWYFTIARNVALDHLRKRQRESKRLAHGREDQDVSAAIVDRAPTIEQAAVELESSEEIVEAVQMAIAQLPASQRQVLELHKLKGIPMAEVAKQLQVREGTLRVRAHRSYKALARLLSPPTQTLVFTCVSLNDKVSSLFFSLGGWN